MSNTIPGAIKRHATLIKLAFTALLLGALVYGVGWQQLVAGLSRARWPWLMAMFGVISCNLVVMAGTLYLLLSKAGVRVSFGRVLLSNALANFYALVIPGDLMAGVSKWVLLSAATGERVKVLSALVLNKVFLGLPPLLFGTLALALDRPFPDLPGGLVIGAGGAAIGGLLLTLHPRSGGTVDGWIRRLAQMGPTWLRDAIEKVLDSLGAFRAIEGRAHLQILSLAALAFWLGIASFLCATQALGLDVPVLTLAWISLALFVSRLLPITFNNLGVREGLLVVALGTNRIEPALAVGVGILMFSNTVWIALLGAGCQAAVALGWLRLADDERVRDLDGGVGPC